MITVNAESTKKQTAQGVCENTLPDLSKIRAAAESYAASSAAEGGSDSAAPRLSAAHIFRRIAAIVNAENHSKELMKPVYGRERYFLSRNKMPKAELTEEQLKETNDFWAPYSFAYKNDPDTQRYFSLVSGHFDPSYISFGLHCLYLRRFWDTPKAAFMTDRNNIDILFPDIKAPETIFRRIGGYYYDVKRCPISEHDAQKRCLDAVNKGRSLVLKPARGGTIKDIVSLSPDMSHDEHEKVLKNTGNKDYICQAIIENHESWRDSSCKGLNVARINTMNTNGTPEIITSYLRVTVNDINNAALDTWAIPINNDGSLGEFAINESSNEKYYSFPDGSSFNGIRLYNYDRLKEDVLKMAGRIPELKAIVWDMTVDSGGNVNIIELNACGGTKVVQSLGMHPYGSKERLREVLDEYLTKRFYYERADWEWDYWEFNNSVSIHKYDGLKKVVRVPEKLRGKPVTTIHAKAFSGKNLEKIIVPDSVKVISENAFSGCGKNCKVVLPFSQTVCTSAYKTIKKLPFGSRFVKSLKKYWVESRVLKVKTLRSIVMQRLSQQRRK